MDTVGDAYVVIGLCDDESGLRDVCNNMLTVAKSMIVTLEEFSREMHVEVGVNMHLSLSLSVCVYIYIYTCVCI